MILYLISAVVMSPLANLSLSKLATDASPNNKEKSFRSAIRLLPRENSRSVL
jgi:hypothetical protein